MARRRVQQYFDTNRKKVVGYFYLENKNRAVKRDLFSFDELEYKITSSGTKKLRSETERNNLFTKRYQKVFVQLMEELHQQNAAVENKNLVKSLAEEWLDYIEYQKTKKTRKTYQSTIDYYLKAVGDYYVDEHDISLISKFMQYLKGLDLSEHTIAKHLRQLRAFFNWINFNDKADKLIKFKITSPTEKDIEVFSEQELIDLETTILRKLEQANTDNRKMMFYNDYRGFKMMRYTGLRRAEVLFLTLTNIRSDTRSVKIRKNDEFNCDPKGKKIREIPISDFLFEFLVEDLKRRSDKEKYYLDNGKGQPYLTSLDRMTARFRKYSEELGIKDSKNRLKPIHSLRATLLSKLDAAGASPFQIQAVAGHEDLSTTQRYVKKVDDLQREALNNIT